MNGLEFTNQELTCLHNVLSVALVHSEKHLFTWIKISESNPSAKACVKMTEDEISSYRSLIEKIESVRGF